MTNGELLKTALDALGELVSRGNRQLSGAHNMVAGVYADYLSLKNRADALPARADADDAALTGAPQ
jgi:hypothetical protein